MIKVGDRVRATEGGREFFSEGDTGTVLELDGQMIYVQFDASSTVKGDGAWYAKLERLELIEPEPPASQDWTPHDRYTAAALTGLLARGNRGNVEQIALWALDQADAMMKWRDVPLDERGGK